MKIVIDIPRKTYEHIRSWGGHGIFNIQGDDNPIVTKAIFNSTPYKERPQGKWIDTGNMEEYWAEEYQCSICGAKDHWHHYCPNCGAYMGESEDEDYEQ